LREIFAFRRHSFKFDTEVYIVLGILVLIAIFGFSVTIYLVDDSAVAGWFYAMVSECLSS
jgi:energy-converting hydrogenase Eha subunit A